MKSPRLNNVTNCKTLASLGLRRPCSQRETDDLLHPSPSAFTTSSIDILAAMRALHSFSPSMVNVNPTLFVLSPFMFLSTPPSLHIATVYANGQNFPVAGTLAGCYHVGMKKATPKKVRTVDIKPAVNKTPTKPRKKTGLSKSDPDYYAKIGAISAAKRKITSEQFAAWARKSHPRKSYNGGRPKKEDGE